MNIFSPQDKILANFDYVKQLLKANISPPILVEIDPSNVCNHACNFCLASHVHAGKQILSEAALLKLCDELIKIKAKAINWTGGGEPTVNPHLKKAIIKIGEEGSIKMGMFTNGSLLDKFDLFDVIAQYFSWMRFSIDAGLPDTYNRIRHTRSSCDWDKVMSNIQKMIAANKAHGNRINVGVGFVVTPENVNEVIPFANLFKDMDITYCQFKPEIVNIERESGIQRNTDFWKVAKDILQEASIILGSKYQANTYKLDDLIDDPKKYGRKYEKCLGSQVSPCIGADGLVYVCTNHRGHKQYSYGSIYEKSFIDIWNDVGLKLEVMKLIEEKEKFAFCTQLCKPHESNKILWELYSDYHKAEDKEQFLREVEARTPQNIDHKEFI